MTKKILSLLIALSVAAASLSAIAETEKGYGDFMAKYSAEYKTLDEIDANKDKLIMELIGEYGCPAEDAEAVFAEFKKSFEENMKNNDSQEDNKENQNNNKDGEKEPVDTVAADVINKKNLLEQLDIIKGAEFEYLSGVRRDSFSGYVADMINYGEDYSSEEGYFKFSDVTEENEEYHAIANLINKGAIIGVGEGLYKPEDDMTINQACAIIVRVTGYDIYKMPDDENDIFYWNRAREMGLLDGIKAGNNEVLTGEKAVTMLYNLLYAEVVSMEFKESKVQYSDNAIFIKEYMNMDYADGIVQANSKTSLNSESGALGENRLQIENEVYYFENGAKLDDYLGKNVRVFYIDDDSGDAKAIIERDNYNKYINVMAKDIEGFDVTDSKLKYIKDGSSKVFEEKIPLNAKIIFNGVAVDYEYNRKRMMQPDVGEITIIDNDRDSKADVVFITSYVYYLGETINSGLPILYDNFKIQPQIDFKSGKVKLLKDGAEVDESQIAMDTLLMVKPSRAVFDADTNYMYVDAENSSSITIEIVTSSVTGNVSSVRSGENEITIDGKVYDISPWVMKSYNITENEKLKMPSLGYNVKAFTDKYGSIVYFVINSRGGLKYGFVVNIFEDDETGEPMLKLFTQDDEMIHAPIAKKVKVHNRWNQSTELTKTSYYAKTVDKSTLLNINGEGIRRTMIKYMLNNDGELKEVYIADLSKGINEDNYSRCFDYYVDEDVFMRGFYSEKKTFIWEEITNMFGTNAFQASSGITSYQFIIAPDGSADNEYQASSTKNIFDGYANIEYYDVTESGMARCAVQYRKAATSKTGEDKGDGVSMVVAEAPTAVWNEEKEEVEYTLKAYAYVAVSVSMFAGDYRTYTFADNELVSKTSKGATKEQKERHSNIPIGELEPGDLITASVSNGVINSYRVHAHKVGEPLVSTGELDYGLFDSDNSPIGENDYPWLQYGYTVKGKIIKAIDNTYFFVDTKNPNGIYRRVVIDYNANARDLLVIYDAKKKTVTPAVSSDIREGDYMISLANKYAVVVRNYE